MPRSSEATRTRILDAAYALFRRRGYTRVSMDEIAAATAVTKRTLYYHFRSKDDLLSAVLEAQHQLAVAAFKTFGDHLSGTPEQIIKRVFDDIAVWSTRPDFAGTGLTFWGWANVPIAPSIKTNIDKSANFFLFIKSSIEI